MTTVLETLIQNAALLLAMMVVFDLFTSRKTVRSQWQRQALVGAILGGLCIGLMLASFRLESGIIFDTRSVLLSLSGLFLGPIATLFAMAMAAVYRLWHGGTGVWTGIGVILSTGGVGILWRHYRPGRLADISVLELYGFGVVVHLVMLGLMLTLPWEAAQRVLAGISFPVLLVYPIATIALGWMLANRLQRENSTDALAASETRYRGVFEAANVGKSVTLSTGEIEVNRAFSDMLGYTPEELRGKTWQELTPTEEIDPINELLASMLRGDKDSIRFEKHYIHKNGSHVLADFSATLQRDRDGNPLQFIVTVVDISDRKRAEETLAETSRLLQEVTDNSPALIYIIDTAGIFQLINRKFGEVFGVPGATLVGKSRELFMPPEIAAQHFANDQQVIASRQPITFEEENEESDGKHTYLSIKFPLFDLQGDVSGICGISTDITGRKQAEERITEQLQELQRWQNAMLDREDRVIELKKEVNDLLSGNGLPPRYPSAVC